MGGAARRVADVDLWEPYFTYPAQPQNTTQDRWRQQRKGIFEIMGKPAYAMYCIFNIVCYCCRSLLYLNKIFPEEEPVPRGYLLGDPECK